MNDIILIVCPDVLGGSLLGLAELASILCDGAQLPARVEEAFGQLAVVGGVIAVEQGLVAALDNEASDVHCQTRLWPLPRLRESKEAVGVCLFAAARLFCNQLAAGFLAWDWRGWRGSLFFFPAAHDTRLADSWDGAYIMLLGC